MANHVLFFTSCIGGGHVFRDLAIEKELKPKLPPDTKIIFASGGNAYKMLKEEGVEVEEIAGMHFPAHLGTASFLMLYFVVLWSEIKQIFDLVRLVKKYKPSMVILDEYFFLADYCRWKKIPVVFMCDFVGVPKPLPFWRNPLRWLLEAFFDWLIAGWLPKRTEKWIFIGDQTHIPTQSWRDRAKSRGIVSVEPITKVQYTAAPPRAEARKRLGVGNEKMITVAVGCSGVGSYLLEAANDAMALLKPKFPDLRIELVCGMGIEPGPIRAKAQPGVTVHGYVRNLEEFFAASDAAVAQCGLTTTTECLMIGVPTIIVPLANHWEQENTARYMQETAKYTRIPADQISAQRLAEALTAMLDGAARPVAPYKGDGHVLAAGMIAEVAGHRTPGALAA